MAKVLVVDDEPLIRAAITELLRSWGYDVTFAETCSDGLSAIKEGEIDIAFVDVRLPDGSGIDLIRQAKREPIKTCFVFLTGHGTIEDAVTAMRLGAEDYITKPIEPARLKILLDKMTEKMDMEQELTLLRRELRKSGAMGPLIGRSAAMQNIYNLIERVATSDASVFITGESGTGKTVIAKTIHDHSKRRKKPFVAVNCAAISPTLIESELFGHEKGSFTGAVQQRRGYFEDANGGTIFLDEITEMPIELQGKLLHVLEESKVRRVGGNQEFDFNVRLITATNRDPMDAIRDGKLREDLYYRINIFPIRAPALREKPEDIPLLAQVFLEKACKEEQRPNCRFEPKALAILKRYDWPGNIRELRNAISRAVILSQDGKITPECLPENIRSAVSKVGKTDRDPVTDPARALN